jgi:hypothetical protein
MRCLLLKEEGPILGYVMYVCLWGASSQEKFYMFLSFTLKIIYVKHLC